MSYKALKKLGVAALALAALGAVTAPASAACGPGYKRVEWRNSGNYVCVLDAAAGNNTIAAPSAGPPPYGQVQGSKLKRKHVKGSVKRKKR